MGIENKIIDEMIEPEEGREYDDEAIKTFLQLASADAMIGGSINPRVET